MGLITWLKRNWNVKSLAPGCYEGKLSAEDTDEDVVVLNSKIVPEGKYRIYNKDAKVWFLKIGAGVTKEMSKAHQFDYEEAAARVKMGCELELQKIADESKYRIFNNDTQAWWLLPGLGITENIFEAHHYSYEEAERFKVESSSGHLELQKIEEPEETPPCFGVAEGFKEYDGEERVVSEDDEDNFIESVEDLKKQIYDLRYRLDAKEQVHQAYKRKLGQDIPLWQGKHAVVVRENNALRRNNECLIEQNNEVREEMEALADKIVGNADEATRLALSHVPFNSKYYSSDGYVDVPDAEREGKEVVPSYPAGERSGVSTKE